ncbi:MAG: SBBP repeat-containing protein [Rhodanobacteraceae bacterium]
MARGRTRNGAIGLAALLASAMSANPVRGAIVFDATYLGGSLPDKVLAVASDSLGNTYVAGFTQSSDFPTKNAAQAANAGGLDAFVAKINASGTAIVWSTYLGGSGNDVVLGLARDTSGAVYVTGYTTSANFPITPNAPQPTFGGGAYDAFVTKLDANGALVYSTFLGGSNLDVANAIAIDAAGGAEVVGFTCSIDFPVVAAFQPQLVGLPIGCFAAQDAFVARLAPGGLGWSWSTYFGGDGKDAANAIAIDTQGRAAITGVTASSDLPAAGIALMGAQGGTDAFVARFAAGMPEYVSYFGGSGDDKALGVAADAAGAIYMTGSTGSPDFPAIAAFQSDLHGFQDAFVAKLVVGSPPRASAWVAYSTFLGGRDDDIGRAIAIDTGAAYVAGETQSVDFPLAMPMQGTLEGPSDAFVARIAAGGALSFSTYLGGDAEDGAYGMALSNGVLRAGPNVHVGGLTYSEDLATMGALQPDAHGAVDGFVAKVRVVP